MRWWYRYCIIVVLEFARNVANPGICSFPNCSFTLSSVSYGVNHFTGLSVGGQGVIRALYRPASLRISARLSLMMLNEQSCSSSFRIGAKLAVAGFGLSLAAAKVVSKIPLTIRTSERIIPSGPSSYLPDDLITRHPPAHPEPVEGSPWACRRVISARDEPVEPQQPAPDTPVLAVKIPQKNIMYKIWR